MVREGIWPYLGDSLRVGTASRSDLASGTVHNGLIPNSRGLIEESLFLVLVSNEANGFGIVVKVDRKPVGSSQLRIPLVMTEGPRHLAAWSHCVQPVDLREALGGLQVPGYMGRVDVSSLASVVENIMGITQVERVP